jgi:hypothetical protein
LVGLDEANTNFESANNDALTAKAENLILKCLRMPFTA